MLRRANHIVKSLDKESELPKPILGVRKKSKSDDNKAERIRKKKEDKDLIKHVLGDDGCIVKALHTKNKSKEKKVRKAAWQDKDDDQSVDVAGNKRLRYIKEQKGRNVDSISTLPTEQYKSQLKNEFERLSGKPNWAKLKWQKGIPSEDELSGSEDELTRRTGNYLDTSTVLPSGVLQMKACKDANFASPSAARLTSVEFHPSAQVVLTAGLDNRLALFQVDGRTNPKIQSVFLDHFPIHAAHFTRDGCQVVMTSHFRAFYYYDMMTGSVVNVPKFKGLEEKCLRRFEVSPDGQFLVFLGGEGNMRLVSAQSKELIDTLRMNGSVEAITFSPDGSKLFSHGDDNEVYVWDLARRACVHRFQDDGCVKGTALAMSQNGQFLATGSHSGVVNIYDAQNVMTSRTPEPLKAVMNLTSPCTQLTFNPSSEILALASSNAENALKMVHLSSMSVFQNWPEGKDALRRIHCMDFSYHGGYFALGNHAGKAPLYRVKHYNDF